MTPDQAIREADEGALRPVYLVVGEERLLVDRVVAKLREATQRGGIQGFNEDKFNAGETQVEAIIAACKMLPMMAARRLVLVRALDRWEKKGAEGEAEERGARDARPLDVLADYAKAPAESTVLVLVAGKLHGSRRLVTDAKKRGHLVACDPLSRKELPAFVRDAARERGNPISADVADLLAEIAGPELGSVSDAVERLSLYVGPKQPITEEAVARVVTRVRQSTVWELIDAISARRLDHALATLADVYDPRDGGLRMLGAVAWSIRQLVKLDSALKGGAELNEAARMAGVNPYKARDVARTLRAIPRGTVEKWLRLLAETDLALKGSRRPAQAVLETMIIAMCA